MRNRSHRHTVEIRGIKKPRKLRVDEIVERIKQGQHLTITNSWGHTGVAEIHRASQQPGVTGTVTWDPQVVADLQVFARSALEWAGHQIREARSALAWVEVAYGPDVDPVKLALDVDRITDRTAELPDDVSLPVVDIAMLVDEGVSLLAFQIACPEDEVGS